MSDKSPMDGEEMEKVRQKYRDMIGAVPPSVEARLQTAGKLDPEGLRLAEAMRSHALYPAAIDNKTVQLIAFAMMLAKGVEGGAMAHARAALRAGASMEELQAVVTLASFYCGITAMNMGGVVLKGVEEKQGK